MLINHFNKQYGAKDMKGRVLSCPLELFYTNSVATMRLRNFIKDETAGSGKNFAHLQEQYPDRDNYLPFV